MNFYNVKTLLIIFLKRRWTRYFRVRGNTYRTENLKLKVKFEKHSNIVQNG